MGFGLLPRVCMRLHAFACVCMRLQKLVAIASQSSGEASALHPQRASEPPRAQRVAKSGRRGLFARATAAALHGRRGHGRLASQLGHFAKWRGHCLWWGKRTSFHGVLGDGRIRSEWCLAGIGCRMGYPRAGRGRSWRSWGGRSLYL